MSGAHLAVTEPLMTMTEQIAVAEKVARAVPLPVICDADAGYGEPVHAMHTVRSFEAAGIAAIHIEDQFFPKRASYHAGLEHVIPMDEFLEKNPLRAPGPQRPRLHHHRPHRRLHRG